MRIILRSIFSLTIFSSIKKSTTEILSETRSFLETSKNISTFVIGIKNLERRISRRKNPSNAATTIRVENSQKKKKIINHRFDPRTSSSQAAKEQANCRFDSRVTFRSEGSNAPHEREGWFEIANPRIDVSTGSADPPRGRLARAAVDVD